jgi:hypothetical protein
MLAACREIACQIRKIPRGTSKFLSIHAVQRGAAGTAATIKDKNLGMTHLGRTISVAIIVVEVRSSCSAMP